MATTTCVMQELGPAAGKVLSAMNKYGTNRIPFNRWIPGMVAGIQRRAAEAQLLRKKSKSFHKVNCWNSRTSSSLRCLLLLSEAAGDQVIRRSVSLPM